VEKGGQYITTTVFSSSAMYLWEEERPAGWRGEGWSKIRRMPFRTAFSAGYTGKYAGDCKTNTV